jgi:gamma-glutamylcyclotransferase (GGCT)/AIG2-like uncharacterized protein YtfP
MSKAKTKVPDEPVVRLFEYGTMQSGERWHSLLRDATFIGTAVTSPEFHLRDIGGYPIMTTGGVTAVHGELYELDCNTLRLTDMHHDHPRWHCRTTIKLANGASAQAYIQTAECVEHRPLIESGSWKALCDAYNRDITVSLKIAELSVREALDAALAGPVRSWATVNAFRARPVLPGASQLPEGVHFVLELVERDTDRQISLRDQWGYALSRLMVDYPRNFNELRQAQGSAVTGDILIQLAAFGRIKHGLGQDGYAEVRTGLALPIEVS